MNCVAAADDGHVLTGSGDKAVKVWRGDELVRTIEAHTYTVRAVAVLPGGAHFVSCGGAVAKLWTLDGALERTFDVRCQFLYDVAVLPDGMHFVIGTGWYETGLSEVRLYHVDGTLVHAFDLSWDDGSSERFGGEPSGDERPRAGTRRVRDAVSQVASGGNGRQSLPNLLAKAASKPFSCATALVSTMNFFMIPLYCNEKMKKIN